PFNNTPFRYNERSSSTKPRTLSATALILLAPLVVLAFQAQADQVRKRDLKSRPFTAGPLKITFIIFGHGLWDYGFDVKMTRFVHPIQVEVENTSGEFTTFDPKRLSLVDKANDQADIRGLIRYDDLTRDGDGLLAAEDRRIAPKASIKDWYDL